MTSIKPPVIEGILPARIAASGRGQYADLTRQGEYVITLPFDLDTWSPGGSSRPVRLARPYSGNRYGHHFPLIGGTEVAIIFTHGNPDRPMIMGALHDSLHQDLVNNLNDTHNLIRTAAHNELVLSAKKEIWIGCGGSYLRINSNGIERGTAGGILEKCASWDRSGPATIDPVLPLLPQSVCVPCLLAEYAQGALLGTK